MKHRSILSAPKPTQNTQVAAQRAKKVVVQQDSLVVRNVPVPTVVWHGPVFKYLNMTDLARFSRVSRCAYHTVKSFEQTPMWYRRKLLAENLVPEHLIVAAELAGIQVQYDTLYRLSHTAAHIFFDLHRMPVSDPWPMAAMCADVKWLNEQYPHHQWLQLTDATRVSAVDYLAFAGKFRILKKLKLDANSLNPFQRANLMYFAALGGDPVTIGSVKKLLSYKTIEPIKCLLKEHPSILFILSEGGHLELLQYYLKTWPKNCKIDYEQLALTAAEHGHFGVYDFIAAAHKVPTNAQNWKRQMIAHFAAQFGDVDRLEKLQQKDPSTMRAEDTQHQTPLHYACMGGQLAVLRQFSDVKTMSSVTKTYKESHLHYAMLKKQTTLIKPLIDDYKNCPTSANLIKRTPLHNCAIAGGWDAFKTLLTLCDKGFLESLQQPKVILLAVDYMQMAFVDQYLATYPASEELFLELACSTMKTMSIFVVKHMVDKHDVQLRLTNDAGQTPLHLVANDIVKKRFVHLMPFIQQVIEEFGIDLIDIADNNGKTVRQIMFDFNGTQYDATKENTLAF